MARATPQNPKNAQIPHWDSGLRVSRGSCGAKAQPLAAARPCGTEYFSPLWERGWSGEKVSQEARCLPTQSSELLFYLIYYQIIRTCGVSKREVSHCLVLRTHFHQKFPAKSRRGTLSCMKRAAAEDAAQCAMQARGPEWRASTQPPDKYQNAIRDAKEARSRRGRGSMRHASEGTRVACVDSAPRQVPKCNT